MLIINFMKLDIPQGNFKGFIFDLDGTLIDSMPIHYRAWDDVVRANGVKERLSEDLFYSLGGVPTVQVAERIGAHYGIELDAERVTREKEEAYLQGLRAGNLKLIEPVVEFARKMSAMHPVAIATGGTPDIAIPAIEAAGLRDVFPIVVTPVDVPPGRGKPAPDMFLLAAKLMGVAPGECLVFEDAEPGLRGAQAAGMTTVLVDSRKLS